MVAFNFENGNIDISCIDYESVYIHNYAFGVALGAWLPLATSAMAPTVPARLLISEGTMIFVA
jgi:hypothetical protein